MAGGELRKLTRRFRPARKMAVFLARVVLPALNVFRWKRYAIFVKDLIRYRSIVTAGGGESIPFLDLYPCLEDRVPVTNVDPHYFYANTWAARRIYLSRVTEHVDVGSQAIFVGMLSAFTEVTFVDIRPLAATLENYHGKQGSILDLPYPNDSVASLSCLHVAEHIGLGRYGDTIAVDGTQRACAELARILAPGGSLLFAVPLGRPRVCFNAHRVHSFGQILNYFSGLDLREFSAIDDNGVFTRNAPTSALEVAEYGCGLFWFVKA